MRSKTWPTRWQPKLWWPAFRSLFSESDKNACDNLCMPFAALLHVCGESMWNEVADAARTNRRLANAFWEAMEFLSLSNEA